MNALRRTAALLEVLGVFVVGPLVMGLLVQWLGVPVTNPLRNLTAEATDAELVTVTRQMFVLLVFQYAGWFLLILPINWWHRRRGPAAYGLTTAGRSWKSLVLAGVATAALAAWPAYSVLLLDAVYELGETVPWRQALFDMSWRRWEFWLFMFVLSFGFIPIVEELFYRGYCQRRLAEDWGDGPAIIGTALMFVFAHGQYLILNAYNISFIVSLIVLAVGAGVVFAWTRSLIPSMVAHAIINVPMTPLWQGIVLLAFVIGAVLIARRGMAVLKQVFSNASVGACVALGVLGIGWAIAAQRIDHLRFVAIGMVVLAVGLEAAERRRARAVVDPNALHAAKVG
jgi:membrane protease YdiL (CAAX protease family)